MDREREAELVEYGRILERQARIRAQLAENAQALEQLRNDALASPGLQEAVRLKAWAELSPGQCRVAGSTVQVPDGWPPTLDDDGDAYLVREVEGMFGGAVDSST